jgi:hypothetical protein
MEMENTILEGCDEISCLATPEALEIFGGFSTTTFTV